MTSIHRLRLAALACAASASLAAQAAPRFHLTDLGDAWQNALPRAINEGGQVVGHTQAGVALSYVGGATTVLGTFGGDQAVAVGVNDNGALVGSSYVFATTTATAFELAGGQSVPLGSLGDSSTQALGINDRGQVVGLSQAGWGGPTQAFVSANGKMRGLGTLPGGYGSVAKAINVNGVITGNAGTTASGNPVHAFRYVHGAMADLGALVPGGFSAGTAINDQGAIAGSASLDTSASPITHAFVTTSAGLKDLGTLPLSRAGLSAADDINTAGHVVGRSDADATCPNTTGRAFFHDAKGMHDLNDLLDGQSPGWCLIEAMAINDTDQVVGVGTFNGVRRAFLLTPVKK